MERQGSPQPLTPAVLAANLRGLADAARAASAAMADVARRLEDTAAVADALEPRDE